jgi:hypothetical protein
LGSSHRASNLGKPAEAIHFLGRRRCGGAIHIGPPAFAGSEGKIGAAVLGFAGAHPRLDTAARIRGLWVKRRAVPN